jgi:hypothetical protein
MLYPLQAPTPTLPRLRGRGLTERLAITILYLQETKPEAERNVIPSPACGGGLGWGLKT